MVAASRTSPAATITSALVSDLQSARQDAIGFPEPCGWFAVVAEQVRELQPEVGGHLRRENALRVHAVLLGVLEIRHILGGLHEGRGSAERVLVSHAGPAGGKVLRRSVDAALAGVD